MKGKNHGRIAECERTLIISRTNHGRVAAKARGVVFGRPRKMRPDQQQVASELVRNGTSISAVARTFDVHPATIYRVIEG
jgi:DNA invertase Pin-like site-specific DNA recombinase